MCIDKLLDMIDKFLIKIDKLLLKRDKNVKSIESKKTMDPLLAKSNTSLTIINNMGVRIPDPNTMKRNATAS